jgi:hypothetical protein
MANVIIQKLDISVPFALDEARPSQAELVIPIELKH